MLTPREMTVKSQSGDIYPLHTFSAYKEREVYVIMRES